MKTYQKITIYLTMALLLITPISSALAVDSSISNNTSQDSTTNSTQTTTSSTDQAVLGAGTGGISGHIYFQDKLHFFPGTPFSVTYIDDKSNVTENWDSGNTDKTGAYSTKPLTGTGTYEIIVSDDLTSVNRTLETVGNGIFGGVVGGGAAAASVAIGVGLFASTPIGWAVGLGIGLGALVGMGITWAGQKINGAVNGNPFRAGYRTVGVVDASKPPTDIDIVTHQVMVNSLTKTMGDATVFFTQFLSSALLASTGAINNLLYSTKQYVLSPDMQQAWVEIRNIAMSLLVLALIVIAFANAVQYDIQNYGLNRVVPKIILSIVMAYFSWLIVSFFFDFTFAIQAQAFGLIMGHANAIDYLGHVSVVNPGGIQAVASIGMLLTAMAIFVIIIISLVVLLVSLLLRIVFLSFLVAVAPLAMMLHILPFTNSLYKRWWTEFWKWMFMGPLAVAIIALGSVMAAPKGSIGGAIMFDPDTMTAGDTAIKLMILAAAIYFAGTLPKMWGGNIMSAYQKNAGKLGNWAWGKTSIPDRYKTFMSGRQSSIDARRKQQMDRLRGNIATKGGALGRLVTGVGMREANSPQLRAEEQKLVKMEADTLYGMGNDQLNAEMLNTKNTFRRKAIMTKLLEGGFYSMKSAENGGSVADQQRLKIFQDMARSDGEIQAAAFKGQAQDLANYGADMHEIGGEGKDLAWKGIKKLTGSKLQDMKPAELEAISKAAEGSGEAADLAKKFIRDLTDGQIKTAHDNKDADFMKTVAEARAKVDRAMPVIDKGAIVRSSEEVEASRRPAPDHSQGTGSYPHDPDNGTRFDG